MSVQDRNLCGKMKSEVKTTQIAPKRCENVKALDVSETIQELAERAVSVFIISSHAAQHLL